MLGYSNTGSPMSETIQTHHPDPGKQGVNISKEKYEIIYSAIESYLREAGHASLKEITMAVKDRIADTFEGSVGWYVTTVKLDMESLGVLVCDRSKSPHVHYLKS